MEQMNMDGEYIRRDPGALWSLLPGLPKDVKLPGSKPEPVY